MGAYYHFLGARFYWGQLSLFGGTIISNIFLNNFGLGFRNCFTEIDVNHMVLVWRCRSPSKPEQTMSFKPSTTHQKRKKRWAEELFLDFKTIILCLLENWLMLHALANSCLNLMLLSVMYLSQIDFITLILYNKQ